MQLVFMLVGVIWLFDWFADAVSQISSQSVGSQNTAPAQVLTLVDIGAKFAFDLILIAGLVGTIVTLVLVNRLDQSIEARKRKLEREVQARTNELMKTKNAVIFGLAKLARA